jgi:CheY-like chemotaxis protein
MQMTPTPEPTLQCRILFVDDDPFYRDLATEALGSARMSLAIANDGEEALASLASATCDLMVLDLSMPGRSGFDILEAVRRDPRLADLPVIVITGNDDEATIARAFELGATSFMVKPLNWPLFVQHIRFVLASAQARYDLRQSQRTAEFMSDLKSRLIGTLVTEFQAPLRSAFGFSRLIKQEVDGPLNSTLYTEWIGELHTALERLSSVHLKMLNFGRSLSDHIELKEESIELGRLVAIQVEACQISAKRRNINLAFDDALPNNVLFRGDSVLMSNAIRAILDNSVKFSPRGAEVVVKLGMSGLSQVTLTVDDAMPPMTQVQIDEVLGLKTFTTVRMEAVELSTGLKMSRVLIEAHQGQMRMQAKGEGMTTTLVMPRDRTARQATTSPKPPLTTNLRRIA